jgi:hypothetical protein
MPSIGSATVDLALVVSALDPHLTLSGNDGIVELWCRTCSYGQRRLHYVAYYGPDRSVDTPLATTLGALFTLALEHVTSVHPAPSA